MAEKKLKEEEDGVLLYYKYTSVPDVKQLSYFYESNCKSLDLLGRVRIAPDGVNVTVGGKLSSLKKHIAAVESNDLFEDTDFKLASCSSPSNDRIAKECGFESLSIRVVKELVTFSSHPLSKSPTISNAGRHLSAVEFDTVLHSAGTSLESCGPSQHKGLLLLDARNVYETRIGRFHTANVETLDPGIRQYSDLPTWIDNHSEQLRGNNILMYCTGGIRCEMASAYIKSKGAGFENVFQLYGGIQRYLETFPDGGFFRGKNFVFDHRISVGSSNAETIGSCLLCASPFDDYSSRCRCTYCRMLVLVCGNCQGKDDAKYICELCQKHGKQDGPVLLTEGTSCRTESTPVGGSSHVELDSSILSVNTTFPELSLNQGMGTSRKLRILCLHGFRQNASGFKGRTASLAKKLKNIVELVFINAPHELPFIYRPRPTESNHTSPEPPSEQTPPLPEHCNKKYAWLVTKEFDKSYGTDWLLVNEPFDPLQYRQQTDGHDVSLSYLKSVFTEMGPFDGILGFSQGAAMAASLCAEQGRSSGEIKFKFAILCSGFALDLDHFEPESVHCPSLHIYGSGKGKDRQIACQTSMELSRVFKKNSSMIIEHESGHIIPTQSPYIDRIKDFLSGFM